MNDLKTELHNHKKEINSYITDHISAEEKILNSIATTSSDALKRLETFATGGKGIRGGLFVITATLLNYKEKETTFKIAAGLELIQAALLIHDDIMDNDFLRRGKPSVFAQYKEVGEQFGTSESLSYGKAMGICVGDVGFFMAMQIIQNAIVNHQHKDQILHYLFKELLVVSLAQMDDVTFAASKQLPKTEDILKMYTYKTAHYTFSLPFCLAAIISGQSKEVISLMEQLGEETGLLFQLKDDEIDVYSDSEISGKPTGSDLRENKKTVLHSLLYEELSLEEQQKLEMLPHKSEITEADIEFYRSLLKKYCIKEKLHSLMQIHTVKAQQIIDKLPFQPKQKAFFNNLLLYVQDRNA